MSSALTISGILPAPTGDHGYRLSSSAVLGIATNPYPFAGVGGFGYRVSIQQLGICRTPGASCDAIGLLNAGYSVVGAGPMCVDAGKEEQAMTRTMPWTARAAEHHVSVCALVDELVWRDGKCDPHEARLVAELQALGTAIERADLGRRLSHMIEDVADVTPWMQRQLRQACDDEPLEAA